MKNLLTISIFCFIERILEYEEIFWGNIGQEFKRIPPSSSVDRVKRMMEFSVLWHQALFQSISVKEMIALVEDWPHEQQNGSQKESKSARKKNACFESQPYKKLKGVSINNALFSFIFKAKLETELASVIPLSDKSDDENTLNFLKINYQILENIFFIAQV